VLNVYAAFAGLFPETFFLRMLAVILLGAVTDLLLIPFSYYNTMVIEEKYGFNRSSGKTFWLDQLKSFLIGILISVIIGSLLMWTHQALGDLLIVVFAGAMTLLLLAIAFLYPVLSRIFNKFTPLEDGELKEKLIGLLGKHGYKVRAIQVMDASRRTTKSNAYFSGFGKMKTIVLFDTMLEQMTTEEICAVFAHEMGHGLHKDTLRSQILSFLQMLVIGVLAWLTLRTPEIWPAFGFDSVNYGFAMMLIMNVEFALIAPLFGLLINYLSRRAEYRADAQAVQEGYGEELISALKKLARENFADLAPSPLLVKLEYSHPTLSQRIDEIRKGR
jgi:STE24 endopeptidase